MAPGGGPPTPRSPRRRDRLAPLPDGPVSRALALTVVLVAALLLAGSGLVDLLWPAPVPRLLGRERIEQQRLRESARFRDGTLARRVEQDLRLTSRVRRTVGPWHSLLLFGLLRDAQDRALVGRGGWVFLDGRAEPADRPERVTLRWTAAYFAALEARLREHGVALTVAPVPRKAALYRDRLPPGHEPRADLDERLPGAIAARGVRVADLFAALSRRREKGLVYFQTDSHWTDGAQIAAAREICRAGGNLSEAAGRRSRIDDLGLAPQERDTLDFVGLHLPDRAIALLGLPRVARYRVRWPEGRPQEPSIALVGTSFSAARILPDLIEHFCQQRVENAAHPGRDPLDSLARWLVESGPSPRPEQVVVEIPNHHVFGRRYLPDGGAPFAVLPGTAWTVVERLAEAGSFELDGDRRHLAGRPAGHLEHAGDGSVALRVRARIDGPVRLHLRSGGAELSTPWPPGATEVLLPLLAPEAGTWSFRLTASGRGSLAIDTIELVAKAGPDRGW